MSVGLFNDIFYIGLRAKWSSAVFVKAPNEIVELLQMGFQENGFSTTPIMTRKRDCNYTFMAVKRDCKLYV